MHIWCHKTPLRDIYWGLNVKILTIWQNRAGRMKDATQKRSFKTWELTRCLLRQKQTLFKRPILFFKISTQTWMGTWRNGSAFDSRSNGWVFKSPCPQLNLLVNETKTYDVSNFTLFLPYILVSVLNWIFRWTKQNRRCLKLHIILTLNAIIFMKTDSIFGNGVLRK